MAARCPAAISRKRRGAIERRRIEHDPLSLCAGIRYRDRRQQRACVRVLWRREQPGRLAHLHDPSPIHHRQPVADVLDKPQVVRDEEVRQLQSLLQIHQQVDDLCLDGDVQRRDRLVGDDERRVERQCAGEADALTLSSAELVRIAREMVRVEARPGRTARARAPGGPPSTPVDG